MTSSWRNVIQDGADLRSVTDETGRDDRSCAAVEEHGRAHTKGFPTFE